MYASGREKKEIEAMDKRRYLACNRVKQQLNFLDNLLSLDKRVVCYRACYKTYTSKNCNVFRLETER